MENEKSKGRAGRPKGSTKNKMSKSEQIKFLKDSQKLILNKHYSHKQYVEYVQEEYKLSRQMANTYWKQVWEDIRDKYTQETDKLVSKHIHKLWELYDLSIDNSDYNVARQVINDIGKLMGIDTPEKLQIEQDLNIRFKFGNE
jgi:hypothetical protein